VTYLGLGPRLRSEYDGQHCSARLCPVQLESAERLGTSTPSNDPSQRFAAASPVMNCRGRLRTARRYCVQPMQSGLLSGAFNTVRAASLPADDWRSRDPNFTSLGLYRNLAWRTPYECLRAAHTTVAPWQWRGRSRGQA